MRDSPVSASPRIARADSPDHLCENKIVSDRVLVVRTAAVPALYGGYLEEGVFWGFLQAMTGCKLSLCLSFGLQRTGQLQVVELGDLLDLEAILLQSWVLYLRRCLLMRLCPRLHQFRLQVPPPQSLLSHHWIRVLLVWTVRLQLLKLELPEHVLQRTRVKQLLPLLQHLGYIDELDALATDVLH